MELARLENEYSMLQVWENRYLDDLRMMQQEILSLEQQENERLSSVEVPLDLHALRKACLQNAAMQAELLKEEKSLKEFQITQLQEELDKLTCSDRAAAKARTACLRKQLQIAKHFNKSLEKKWKDATKSLSSVKSAIIKWDSCPCTNEQFTRSYLDQRLKDKEADLDRMQRQRSRLEETKRLVATNCLPDDLPLVSDAASVSEFEIESTPLCRAVQENIALAMEKQHLEQQCKSLGQRKRVQIERLDRAKGELEALKEKLETHGEETNELENCKMAMEQLDNEAEQLETLCISLQQQVEEGNEQINVAKNEIIQSLSQSAKNNETLSVKAQELEKAISARKSDLIQLQDKIEAVTAERNELKDQNMVLAIECREISSRDEVKDLLEKKAKESEEINQLKNRIDHQKAAQNNTSRIIGELRVQIADLASDIDQITEQGDELTDSNRSRMSSLKAEISALESDIQRLMECTLETEGATKEAQCKLAELEDTLARRKQLREELQERLGVISKENELAANLITVTEQRLQADKQKEQTKGLLSTLLGRWK